MTDQAVSGLDSSGDLVGTELLYSDNGSKDVKVTPAKILAYVKNALTGGDDLGALALLDTADNAHLASMATSTIKGRKSAGSGAPEDLSASDLATILNVVGGVMKSKIIATTKDLTGANGATQAITGVGFKPTSIIAFSTVTGYASFGISDVAKAARTVMTASAGSGWDSTNDGKVIHLYSSASNYQSATLTSYDTDGFTLTWSKSGTPTGTANLFFLCLR